MFQSMKSEAPKKTPTASRSLARRTRQTARKAAVAHSTTIRLDLWSTGSEKSEYFPENHWNAQYQSQPSPAMTKQTSIHHDLVLVLSWSVIACRADIQSGMVDAQTSFLITDQSAVKITVVTRLSHQLAPFVRRKPRSIAIY
jgi:hypothetical protein